MRKTGLISEPARRRTLSVVLAALLIIGAAPAAALEPTTRPEGQLPEYDVKAAYLFNFAKFIEWPIDRFDGPGTPLRLCVFGSDPFGDALQGLEGKTVRERRIVTISIRKTSRARDCHILFVPRREFRLIDEVLEEAGAGGVLTVTEMEDEAATRGIINLIQRGQRVVFQIAPSRAEDSGLRISSRLLQLAEVIGPSRNPAQPSGATR